VLRKRRSHVEMHNATEDGATYVTSHVDRVEMLAQIPASRTSPHCDRLMGRIWADATVNWLAPNILVPRCGGQGMLAGSPSSRSCRNIAAGEGVDCFCM
jgi:hypothetical protein